MLDVSKYIQIPYKSGGRDFDGCDCYGLVRLVLEKEFEKVLPDYSQEYDNANNVKVTAPIIKKYKPLLTGKKKESPDIGDLAVFNYRGLPSHIGIYVGEGRILHILSNSKYSVCEKLNSPYLRGRLEGFYEVR